MEFALISRANQTKRCHLDNNISPQEPVLSEAEKADTQEFLPELLQSLPLAGLRAFEFTKAVSQPHTRDSSTSLVSSVELDTFIVPAQKNGGDEIFLGQD